MPIHHAVLALLVEGPSYGYELKGMFEEAIGPQWGELNIGHLYQILERLERDGLVTKRVHPQARRPARSVYRLTAAGQKELEDWLQAPFVRESGYRDDFFLKLFAAARVGGEALDGVIATQRTAYAQELAALADLRAEFKGEPLVRLLIEAATLHTEANLRVVDLAENARADFSARAADQKTVQQAEEPNRSHTRRAAR
jgi:DNA-binding PadR family transcriptional regulator